MFAAESARHVHVVLLENAVHQPYEGVGRRRDVAPRAPVHEPDDLGDHVDQRRTGVAGHAGYAREQRVRQIGKRRAATDLVEPCTLEPRPRRIALEVQHGARDLPAPNDRQRLDVHRVLEEEHGLVRRFVARDHPGDARHVVGEAHVQLLHAGVDAVPRGHDDLIALGEHTGAARRVDLHARGMERAPERAGCRGRHGGHREQQERCHPGGEHAPILRRAAAGGKWLGCREFDRPSPGGSPSVARGRMDPPLAADRMLAKSWTEAEPTAFASTAWRPRVASIAMVLGTAAVYVVAANLGLRLALVADQVTLVWPPTGIALAALLVLGNRLTPGIALGAFVANITHHEPVGTACGIALGNTLEAVVGAWLLRRVGFDPALERLRDVLALIVLAALGSTVVAATIGVTSLCLGGVQPWNAFASLWWTWWVGDAMGDLVMAPVLLVWSCAPRSGWRPRRVAEGVALLGALVLVGVLVFVQPDGT